jgi:hypothetical protein
VGALQRVSQRFDMTPPELRKPYYCLRSNNGVAILSSTDSSSTGVSYAASPQGNSGGFYLFLPGGLLIPLEVGPPTILQADSWGGNPARRGVVVPSGQASAVLDAVQDASGRLRRCPQARLSRTPRETHFPYDEGG